MSASAADVVLRLERPLPVTLTRGRATALYLYGTCFHRFADLAGMEILVDGRASAADAFAMPRLDLFRSLHPQLGSGERPVPAADPASPEDPEVRAYRSGFWATPTVPAPGPGQEEVAIDARLTLEGGERIEVEVARIPVSEPVLGSGAPREDGPELIAVCMATCNPDPELFRIQVKSLREQSDRDWVCVVSDDCSRPETFAAIEAELAGDERFLLSRSERRLGVYRSFERALGLIPERATLVGLCDQDDRWYPEKLATLRREIGGSQLAYSDMRLVDTEGAILAETYWTDRSNNHTDLISLLVANTVTGAASLVRREVVELALPFPEVPGEQFHDHWLALVALSLGEITYVDRPLYDYVQHSGAALGHAAANLGLRPTAPPPHRDPLQLRRLRRRYSPSRPGYFRAYLRLRVLARVLLARCGDRIARRKSRALERFARAETSPAGALALLLRTQRARLGRDETLGIERMLFRGILWRRQLELRSRGVRRPEGSLDDAADPEPRATVAASVHGHAETTHIERMLEPLELAVSSSEPERVNLLIPSIDLKHLFGGYIGKFNLARKLAQSGRRVRIVTVNRTPPLAPDWRSQLSSYSGLDGLLDEVEIAFGREGGPLAVNPGDRFIATTWWTAYAAHEAGRELGAERFLYLIQEYEPYTFPMGSLAALASGSYELPHTAMFSTELLRRFFAERGYGVYAAGVERGDADSISFQNAITAVEPPTADELANRSSRRLLFYARSEPHARRNMFELGLIAIMRALERGTLDPSWELAGVGSVEGRSEISLPRGATLRMLPRRSQQAYANMLPEYDVGLALMFTPHPSLVPIEMASAGLSTVTNSFETKTAEAMAEISSNLLVAEPRIESIVDALEHAIERTADHRARAEGARVSWSRDWDKSLDAAKIEQVGSLLGRR